MKKTLVIIGLSCAALIVGGFIALFVAFYMDMEKGEQHQRQMREDQRSGHWDFGDEPALFAVAQGIVKNDQEAIRAAAKALPDLNAPGRDGTTLLYFAVTQSWQRPELVEAVKTLLSLGLDPNYTNGHRNSFAMSNAVHGSVVLLRTMLDAGGNPNTRNEFGRPMILMNWYLGYYPNDARARLDLLLDRAADINSAMPETDSDKAGYNLLLYRTEMGPRYSEAYADAMHLLERGADPNHVAGDGQTFVKMLMEQRKQFPIGKTPPQFERLWEWAQAHGILGEK
jgi:ankyrin repeat protein